MNCSKATTGHYRRLLTATATAMALSFGTVASVHAQTVAEGSARGGAPVAPAARQTPTPPMLLHPERVIHELGVGLEGWLAGLDIRTRTELRLLVDTDGRVIRSEVSESSGYPKIDATLRRHATALRFRPAVVEGRAISAFVTLPIDVGAPE